MTLVPIPLECVADRLTWKIPPGLWEKVLAVLKEEFLQRYRAEAAQLGICESVRVPIGSDRTRADGQQLVDSRCLSGTRAHHGCYQKGYQSSIDE